MNIKKLIGASIVFGLVAAAPLTFAQDQNSLVFPPDSRPFGKKYKEWSAEWWQFVLSIPVSENPLLDETGEKCVVGQHGAVWFLVGVFNTSGTAVRNECSVPAGKALFFPVLNEVNINVPNNVCGIPENETADELRAQIAPDVDSATNLSVEVDGEPIQKLQKRFRVKSEVFEVTFPEDNLLARCVPAGTYSPAVDDGFYVMLKPLAVGAHTVRIRGEFPGAFSLDVTYHLTVVPVKLE